MRVSRCKFGYLSNVAFVVCISKVRKKPGGFFVLCVSKRRRALYRKKKRTKWYESSFNDGISRLTM